MNHFSEKQWEKYVKNEVDESCREEYESHLYNCDQCLEVYLEVVDGLKNELPSLSNQEALLED